MHIHAHKSSLQISPHCIPIIHHHEAVHQLHQRKATLFWARLEWKVLPLKSQRVRSNCGDLTNKNVSDWWFGTFFIFHNIWDNPSH